MLAPFPPDRTIAKVTVRPELVEGHHLFLKKMRGFDKLSPNGSGFDRLLQCPPGQEREWLTVFPIKARQRPGAGRTRSSVRSAFARPDRQRQRPLSRNNAPRTGARRTNRRRPDAH